MIGSSSKKKYFIKKLIDSIFFCRGQGLIPESCIYYALSIPTELSSRGQLIGSIDNTIQLTRF